MKLIRSKAELSRFLDHRKRRGKTVGFVPTMGALHTGHGVLMKRAKEECDILVVSIFVNPLQFGPTEDYRKYPRKTATDKKFCLDEGVDFLYMPNVKTFYKQPFLTTVSVSQLTNGLCGESRPTHFLGVTTVVCKLFQHVQPDRAYFGKKDFQQLRVIEQMVEDLDFSVKIRACAIVREADGLAMSSRNRYLTESEREQAGAIIVALREAKRRIKKGERESRKIKLHIRSQLRKAGLKIDYVEVVDSVSLVKRRRIQGKILLAAACFCGRARLIDNLELRV